MKRFIDDSLEDTDQTLRSDGSERQEVISKLKARIQDGSLEKQVIWGASFISVETGSTLHQAMEPGVVLLKQMIRQPAFQAILAKRRLPADVAIHVRDTGDIVANTLTSTQSLASSVRLEPDLNDDLQTLVEIAGAMGGEVSLEDHVSLVQWLTFYQFKVPVNGIETQKLLSLLEAQYPTPDLGNYWELLSGNGDSPMSLSSAECQRVRALTQAFIEDSGTLLGHFSSKVADWRARVTRDPNTDEHWLALAADPLARTFAYDCIKALDWYGATPDQPVSEHSLAQVLLAAILLDLHPAIGADEPRNHVAGFNLCAPKHIENALSAVRWKLEEHLLDNPAITPTIVGLASHLLLAGAAPEFLVKDVPPSLLLGTSQWMEFRRCVALAEINAPGSTRLMPYAQIMKQANIDSLSESLDALSSLLATQTLLDWALLNGVVTLEALDRSTEQALQSAIAAFNVVPETLAQVADTLAKPLPTRREIALEQLKQAAPDCDYLEQRILYKTVNNAGDLFGGYPMGMSMVELHMSGDLRVTDWDIRRGKSPYRDYPNLMANLGSVETEFRRQFNHAHGPLADAMDVNLKLVLSLLPPLDRNRLLCGNLTFFTLRPSVAVNVTPDHPIPSFGIGQSIISTVDLISGTSPGFGPKETPKDKIAATGRYGVVICSEINGKFHCYELFTLHGQCRENPQLADFIINNGLLHMPADFELTKNIHDFHNPRALQQLPTDLESYTHGVPPGANKSSLGIIDKLGVMRPLRTSSTIEHMGSLETFQTEQFAPIVNFVQERRPLASHQELMAEARGETRLEKYIRERDNTIDNILNFIIPFKSCIQDIASDNPHRQREGIFFCTLEVAMTLLMVVGVVAKIVSIAAKAASLASKASRLAKVGFGFLNSLFNPLEGVPQLLRGAAKLLKTGGLKLANAGAQTLETATLQLRQLTGSTQAYDAVKGANLADGALGLWRPLDSTRDALVLATRHNDQWYALSRLGQPQGPKLKTFKIFSRLRLPKFHKLLPASYARKLVKDTLPVARNKVDDAIRVMTDAQFERDSGSVMKFLMGDNSPRARQQFLDSVTDVKNDFKSVTVDNYDLATFRPLDDDGHEIKDLLASLFPDEYKKWTVAAPADAAKTKFMRVYTHNFNQQFRKEGFSYSVTADDLIHEMFHGKPGTSDHAYAALSQSGRQDNYQRLDVGPLMNLASGHHPDPKRLGAIPTLHLDKTLAFDNADSFSLTVALLNQRSTDNVMFLQNITTMQKAMERSRGGYIGWEVVLHLNPV